MAQEEGASSPGSRVEPSMSINVHEEPGRESQYGFDLTQAGCSVVGRDMTGARLKPLPYKSGVEGPTGNKAVALITFCIWLVNAINHKLDAIEHCLITLISYN